MEQKNFCLVERFTSYDDLKKNEKVEEEIFLNVWSRDSRKSEAARVKKK